MLCLIHGKGIYFVSTCVALFLTKIFRHDRPYNGHTTAQDALYGGVPVVTRSDGVDMASRVTTSANIVLGLEELNAYDGSRHYEDISIELGKDDSKLQKIREKLIATATQKNPMHPYWDVPRYVKNFETGLKMAWKRYLSGEPPDHIFVVESDDTKKGSFEDVFVANPPEGKPSLETSRDEL
jgi:protein O-GlcNAc transferase